jgi:riboflavin synthase
MFTGIIEGLGAIDAVAFSAGGCRLRVAAGFDLDATRVGDSIAVNGACLTVAAIAGRAFEVDVSPETIACTTLSQAHVGDRVNLERALRFGARLDGHLVSGHIDGIGRVEAKHARANAVIFDFGAPPGLARCMVAKGSVAVDGISLTINTCRPDGFQVCVIPHTAAVTTLSFKRVGDKVNIETDLIGKYVERFVAAGREASPGGLTMAKLVDTGFL